MSALYAIAIAVSLSAAGHADELQDKQSTIAIDKIKKLGAVVGKMKYDKNLAADERVRYIMLADEWKGSDEDLAYVEQIKNTRMLILVGNVKISDKRLKLLNETVPRIVVYRRKSDARIGIRPNQKSTGNGVLIDSVGENTPAAQVGLQNGDLITQFDNQPVKDWDQFLDIVGDKKSGDEVTVRINRDETSMEFKVILDSWLSYIEERE